MSMKYWINQAKYDGNFFLESVMISCGLKKELSQKAFFAKQKYYENLSIEHYEEELGKWYELAQGKACNFNNPIRFTEKIQWLKLYDSTIQKARLADKYRVREWVKAEIGEQYLIPLLGVWDSFDDIKFDELPSRFVLKCNHGAKMNIIVKDKNKFDKVEAKNKIDFWLKQDFGICDGTFQLQYSLIHRKIVAEKFMVEDEGKDLKDYKFFCFNGEPKYCQVISERTENESVDFFDMKWNHLSFTGMVCFKNSDVPIEKPVTFELMVDFARQLSSEFAFVRVDFYEVNGELYFGEMTFTPASGMGHFKPCEMDETMGQMIVLPEKKSIPDLKKKYNY